MTNSTALHTSKSTTASSDVITEGTPARRSGRLRRSVTGLVAAVSIAFGGSALIAPQEAQAAGVHTQNYVHTQGSSDSTRVRTTPYAVQASKPTVSSAQRQRRSA